MLKISVVIPTLNRADDLTRGVRSVLTQSRPPDELLIIDQSPGRESRSAVEALFESRQQLPELRYIHDKAIRGLVAAKKVAVGRSKGDIVVFLEDDVILTPTYIENIARGFEEHPHMLGCCGVVLDVPLFTRFYRAMFHLFHRNIFYDRRVSVHGNPSAWSREMIASTFLSGGVSAYRREVFVEVPFDVVNDFFMLEDIDFSTRAARKFGNDKFFINTSARLSHALSPVNRARAGAKYERKFREYICYYKKNQDRRGALSSLLWLLLGLYAEAMIASMKLRNLSPLRGAMRGLLAGIHWRIQDVESEVRKSFDPPA